MDVDLQAEGVMNLIGDFQKLNELLAGEDMGMLRRGLEANGRASEGRWNPWAVGDLKRNVDASTGSTRGVGLGMVLRDSQGKVLKAATNFQEGKVGVLAAEVLALLFRLNEIAKMV